MKFTCNFADDQRPAGWHEDHGFATRDLVKAEELAQAMVADFNISLRPDELPRRLLKIEVAHPRKRFCKIEFVVDEITYRAELRADGLHVRRKGSPKFRVLAMRDALQVLNGQGLLKLD